MNGLNLNEQDLLAKYRTTKDLEIERLLSQYGTSLKDMREMYPQLTETIKARQLTTAFPTQPLFFTPSEAAQMGLRLDEGAMLKMSPIEGNGGFTSSIVLPSKWEITEDNYYISPSGQKLTEADMQAWLSEPTGQVIPEGFEFQPTLTIENLTEVGKAAYQEYQQAGGTLGVAGWVDLRERQKLETEQVFGAVFPEQDIAEVLAYMRENPEGFLADVREIGPTQEMVTLLKTLEFQDEDGTVRHLTEEEIQGFFTEAVPEYIPEGKLKDTWDAFVAGGMGFIQGIETYLFTNPPAKPTPETASILVNAWATRTTTIAPEFTFEYAMQKYEQGLQSTVEGYLRRREEQQEFWISHPELAPKPEYLQSPLDNPSLLKDPGYWGYSIANSLAYSLAVMGTMMIPYVGIPLGFAVAGMPEAGHMIDELVDKGVPIEQATGPAQWYGLAAGAIEGVTDLPFLGLVVKPFKSVMQPFWNTVLKGFASRIVKGLVTGVLVTQGEALEEVLTQVIHNAIVKHYDETQSLLEGVSHAYIQASIASLPFGGIGGYASFTTFRSNLSQETGQKFDKLVTDFQKAGLTEEQAQVQAANEIAKTEEGYNDLSKAIEAAQIEYYEEHPEAERPSIEPTIPTLPDSILQDIKIAEEIGKPKGIAMPVSVQQEFITQARSWLEQIPDVQPSSSYTVPIAEGQAFIRTDSQGNIAVAATAQMREGKLTLSTVVSTKKGMGIGKPGQDLISWIESNNIALPPTVEMSPEALRAYGTYLKRRGVEAVKPTAIPETPPGMPEAGLQAGIPGMAAAEVVRPQPTGKLVQARIDDYLRLREYNKKAISDRIAEIKKALEKKGRSELGIKGNLKLELARLEAMQELEAVENVIELDQLIQKVWNEMGLRSLPFHGAAKNIFPGYTTKQLDEMMKVYQEARQTLYPEMPGTTLVKAEDISVDLPAVTHGQLTAEQVQKTLALFKDAVAAPNAQVQRAAALELRKHVFAQRASQAKESAEAMIVEGMNPEEAIKAAEQMFMTGKLPDLTTDYFDDLTQEMRNVLFAKVYNYWKDKSWSEMMSGFEALTNALAGKSIPRIKGIGTQYFPDGGSAWDRLARVFVGDVEVLEALDRQLPLPKIIEGVFLQTGRHQVPLNQDTVDWLKTLSTISEEDKLLLTKPLSELTQTDVRLIAERWFYDRRKELQVLLRAGTISRQEYELELGIAKDRVFPYKPVAPAITFPTGPVGQARLGEEYVAPQPVEETRTEAELRLKREAMKAEKELAEARAKRAKEPFQPVMLDAALNDELSKQLPLLTLREKGTIIRTLKNIGMTIVDIGNAARTFKTIFDLSYWRQAITLGAGHPVDFYSSNIDAWKALFNQQAADGQQELITRNPRFEEYEHIRKKTGADPLRVLVVPKGTAQWRAAEEFGYLTEERPIPKFMAGQRIVNVPGRHYVAGLNSLVWRIWNKEYDLAIRESEKVASGEIVLPEGEAFSIHERMAKVQAYLADAIQRASLGKASNLAPALTATFFAPRSKLARFLYPRHLISSDPRVRALAWKDFVAWTGVRISVIMLGWWLGLWDVEDDPRSGEFGSIRIGNLRIDPWGGYRQFLVLYARLITKTGISSVTGKEYEVDPLGALGSFFRNSLSPLAGALVDFYTGEDFKGDVVDIANLDQWIDRIAPMAIQDIYEAFQDSWQHGLIAILPAIVGEGVQSYTGDWKENWTKIGLPKYPENTGYGIYEPLYDLADFWADTASQFKGVDPAEITEAKGFPPYVRSIVQALQIIDQIELLPNKKLASINADPEEGTTFIQYYQMWQDRQKIVASGDKEALKAFDADERTQNASLGNMTQAQYALLVEYHSLPEGEKADFLGRHPELLANPKEEWLRSHPTENALLALWLDPESHGSEADIYSLEALTKMESLAKSLGIPESAMFDRDIDEITELKLKNQKLFDLVEAFKGLDDTFKGPDGLTARDRAVQQLYLDNPEFRDDTRRIEALGVGTETNPTPESLIQGWVERGQLVDDFGASSAEVKLYMIDNKEVHQWALDNALLTDTGEDWNENLLRLQVQYQEQFTLYDSYGDRDSPNYIANDGTRADAREALLFKNGKITEFGTAYYTSQAYSKDVPETYINLYVDYYRLPTAGYGQERFLMDNSDYYEEVWLGILGNQPKDFGKVPTVQEEKLLNYYDGLPTGTPRLSARCQDADLDGVLVRLRGLTPAYGTDRCQ